MKLDRDRQRLLLDLATAERTVAVREEFPPAQLPEVEEYERAMREHRRAVDAAAAAQMAVDDIDNEILRIQTDERLLRQRERDDKAQLTAETDPARRKELEHDRYAAKSRIADLMSELAEAHNQIHALRQNRDIHQERVRTAADKVDSARRAAEAATSSAAAQEDPRQRAARLREVLPADIIAQYDARRTENGVGVAALSGGRSCGACFLTLTATALREIQATDPDELPECPNCGAFLVREGA